MQPQAAILTGVPPHASFLFLNLRHGRDAAAAARALTAPAHPEHLLIGFGATLLSALGAEIPGLRPIPALSANGVSSPRTPSDLLLRVAGEDPGEVMHRERAALAALGDWEVADQVNGFMYGPSRDLSGYEDGTENPTGERAVEAAFQQAGAGLAGSSVVAVQRWIHDMDALEAMSEPQRDNIIGRERRSNEELEAAPETAHVKRTAQEDFEPEAFVVRRSMPWRDHRGAGLVFVSFAATLDPFEAQLRRMMGLDDGLVDGLFSFTRPVSGGAWWCPPLADGRLDLRACLSA